MSHLILDGQGFQKYVYSAGDGSVGDPYQIITRKETEQKMLDGKQFLHSKSNTLSNGGVFKYLIKTPSNKTVTLENIITASTAAPVHFDLFEGTIVSANGTTQNFFSTNRIIGGSPGTLLYSTPTTTDDGTLLITLVNNGDKNIGGSGFWRFKLILNTSTNYMLQITNSSPATSDVHTDILISEK